jgi:hypothetical protein
MGYPILAERWRCNMTKITERKLLKLITARGGAAGSRELAIACGIEYGDTSKVVPLLKRLEKAGLVANCYSSGRDDLNVREREALGSAVKRLPTASSFWVKRTG